MQSSIQNSQMIKTRHNRLIFKDGKPVLNCSHRHYGMYYKCPDKNVDEHLHCIRCGTILVHNIKLRRHMDKAKIYNSKVSHERLIDNIPSYTIMD